MRVIPGGRAGAPDAEGAAVRVKVEAAEAGMYGVSVVSVAVVGARGYSGAELLRLLARHPQVDDVRAVSDGAAGAPIRSEVWDGPAGDFVSTEAFYDGAAPVAVTFLALPAEASAHQAPKALAFSTHVVDLSGAYRLPAARYPEAYGFPHPAPDLVETAHYGMAEWWTPRAATRLVANPGCYPTAAFLSLAPLLKAGLLRVDRPIIVDGKSGVTGAGRKLDPGLLYSEVDESLRAYRVDRHPHRDEMARHLGRVAGGAIALRFVPHLVPMRRGLQTTAYATAVDGVTASDLDAAYAEAYGDSPLVRAVATPPATGRLTPGNGAAVYAAFDADTQVVTAIGAIDNLGKGAAGQAIQNMNHMLGLPETTGL